MTRNQVILAAVGMAGTDDDGMSWPDRVAEAAVRITALLDERSRPARAVEQIEQAKVFAATVEAIRREDSSTRAVVTLRTKPSEHHPDGLEKVRTERTDQPRGLAMARRLQGLRGHRAMLWVEVEAVSAGRSVRVVRWVEDLGVARTAETDDDAPARSAS